MNTECSIFAEGFRVKYLFHVFKQHKITSAPFFFFWRYGPTRAMASSFLRFIGHTQRLTTFGRTPLDE